MAAEVVRCTRCPLHLSRRNAVPGEGAGGARVLLVGEAPGRNEDLQGRPFVGAAGMRLNGLLREAGLERASVFITNIVKCRPPENRRPAQSEALACRPYLDRQIRLVGPAVVVLMGDSALKQFFPDLSLAGAHGVPQGSGPTVFFPTYHPAAMIYNQALAPVLEEDFRRLGRLLAGR